MRVVAIHQPNFFPWLGFFDKIANAHAFVFLDGVSFPKNSWVNRVRLNIQGEARWTTCPVQRATMGGAIAGVLIDDSKPWRDKLLKTLDASYRRAAHFAGAMAILEPLIQSKETRLADFNIAAISAIAQALGLTTRLLRQTELTHEGSSNELLVSLVKAAGGQAYLIGGGAGEYHDDRPFETAGISVVKQQFEAKSYGPADRFVPGLSVLDYLMHDGRPLGDVSLPETRPA
jgi:hypothetical protein